MRSNKTQNNNISQNGLIVLLGFIVEEGTNKRLGAMILIRYL